MNQSVAGLKIAMLVANGFEQVELVGPRKALQEAGAKTILISPHGPRVQGWNHDNRGDTFDVDVPLQNANPNDYDALVLPGGVMNPDTLRITPGAIAFIKACVDADKPIAAICHGPWTLIDAQAVKGRTVTSWPSIRIDLENAGATWINQEVVIDGNLITSRKPADIPAFNQAMLERFAAHRK